ncbi:MAG: hypothetical protein R3F11_16870 [Verrucomicrobiales bacterium]
MFWDSDHFPNQPSTSREFSDAKVRGIDHELEHLHRRVERLALSCQAMWELLREHTPLSEAQLREKILEVDRRDGRVDGQIAPKMVNCPRCGRPTSKTRQSCLWCGEIVPHEHAFE